MIANVACTWLAIATAALASPGFAGAAGPPPATGDAQVIAQGVLEFADDFYQWGVSEQSVDAAGVTLVADTYTFLVAGGESPLVVTSADGTRVHLTAGEAQFRYTGSSTNASWPAAGRRP